MWYIWKARNDNRFQRKTWNPWQVHHQATAHLHTHKLIQLEGLQQDQQEVPNLLATTTSSGRQHHSQQTQGIESPNADTSTHQVDRYTIWVPALLPGVRCFVDAFALPDQPSQHARRAGIGILFVNTQVHPVQTIYIKAAMTETQSVITVEAAAMALAAMVMDRLGFNDVSFLSDCSQLVRFLNAEDHNHPPDWRMKAFTQIFDNCVSNRQAKVYRISRTLNTTADALARLAFSAHVNNSQTSEIACSYTAHDQQCPLRSALNSVTLHSVRVLAASCC